MIKFCSYKTQGKYWKQYYNISYNNQTVIHILCLSALNSGRYYLSLIWNIALLVPYSFYVPFYAYVYHWMLKCLVMRFMLVFVLFYYDESWEVRTPHIECVVGSFLDLIGVCVQQ